jgi:hypothetical protein
MAITVSMWSGKTGEIKRFLKSFFQREVRVEEDIRQWFYIYNKPLEAIDIISAVMDNKDRFQIALCIQVEKGDLVVINDENYNDVIKGIIQLFYREPQEITY